MTMCYLPTVPLRCLLALVLSLGVTACAGPRPAASVPAAGMSTERRLSDLERRVQRLEGRPPVQAPYRGRAEIQAQIDDLEAQRAKLLVKFTPQYPAVKDIDRELRILNEQLRMLPK